jgi:CheY-like chemotaxis protein
VLSVSPKSSPSLRTLVADDDPLDQQQLAEMLRGMGHTAVVAVDGREVLSLYRQGSIDLLFIDSEMMDEDGLLTVVHIRTLEQQTGNYVPIVVLNGGPVDSCREICFDTGVNCYLSKPVCHDQLQTLVRALSHPDKPQLANAPVRWNRAATLERSGGDEQFLDEILRLFSEQKTKLMAQMDRALSEHDSASIESAARHLKEELNYLGAAELSEMVRRLEDMAKRRDLLAAEEMTVVVFAQLEEMGAAMARHTQ